MDRSAAAPTLVEQASDRLAFAIASGEYPPGARLPSVRSLAAQYGINPSTVQVVLARHTSVGFVEAHDRVGYVVRDIRLVGGIETWRHLFRFSRQLPDLAAAMLADILATRRRLVEAVSSRWISGRNVSNSSRQKSSVSAGMEERSRSRSRKAFSRRRSGISRMV